MTITVQSIVDAMKAKPFDSFLFKFLEQVPLDESLHGHQFVYRPRIEKATHTHQPESETLLEFLYEANEVLTVSAERGFFNKYNKAEPSRVRWLVENDIKSTVLASEVTYRDMELRLKFKRANSPDQSDLYVGSIGNVRFYSDAARYPEHKICCVGDIFTVIDSDKLQMYATDPEAISSSNGEKTVQCISRSFFSMDPKTFR